jgi:hypothetical protein
LRFFTLQSGPGVRNRLGLSSGITRRTFDSLTASCDTTAPILVRRARLSMLATEFISATTTGADELKPAVEHLPRRRVLR